MSREHINIDTANLLEIMNQAHSFTSILNQEGSESCFKGLYITAPSWAPGDTQSTVTAVIETAEGSETTLADLTAGCDIHVGPYTLVEVGECGGDWYMEFKAEQEARTQTIQLSDDFSDNTFTLTDRRDY